MDELSLAIAEACSWLRSLNRDRAGEDVAARLEAAAPQVKSELAKQHPGYAETWAEPATPAELLE